MKFNIVGKEDNYKYLVALYTHHFRERLTFFVFCFCFLASLFLGNLRQEAQVKPQVASRYRPFSGSCDLFIRKVLNFNFEFKVLTDRNKRSET